MQNSRARAATGSGFLTHGLLLLSLTTRLPDFQDKWHLSDVKLSLVLLMMILLAGVGSVVAETLAKRRDSATLLRSGLLLIAVAVPLLCLAPTTAVYVAGMAGYGIGLGVVDASTIMQAVAIAHRYGRPILPSFHGAWTLGGVIGALIGLATAESSLQVSAVVGIVPLVVAFGPFLPRDHGPTELPTEVAVPWRPIILVGIAMVLFYMVDTGVQTWGPLFLDHTFTTPERYVALSALAYLLASGAVRIAGDWLVSRLGVVVILRVGALIGTAGLAVVVFSPTWQVAVLGFAVLGAGVAV
ncbi:MFS transporter, partial [Nocardioides hankookensis]